MSQRRRNERVRTPRLELLEDRRLLANVNVSNLNDVVNGTVTSIAALVANTGGDGISLREAILAANADNTDPADTIGFSFVGAASIQLTNAGHVGEIAITNNLTINGPGAGALTIRAFAGTAAVGDGARVFNVDDGAAGLQDIAISGVALRGGDASGSGGAIRTAENLTVSSCTISGNTALNGGGIAKVGSTGQLTVSQSTIGGNTATSAGGGIHAGGGSLNVFHSTVSGNTATGNAGGGVWCSNTLTTIDSSTISANQALFAGGVQHSAPGGALMTIANSTISGNSSRGDAGGVAAFYGNVTIRHSTITANLADSDANATGSGGGVFVAAMLSSATIDHTIVAGNLRPGSLRDDVSGALSASFSLIGDNAGATITNNGGNQIGTGGSPINPLLGSLTDNGGPTFTHALMAGSPAIDSGDLAFAPPPPNDQRGAPFIRVADGDGIPGARIDIGAYERQTIAGSFFIVDTFTDENDGNFSAGDLSLREAISLAFGNVGDETISFAGSLTRGGPATINLTSLGQLTITDSVTINGPGANLLTIRAFDPDFAGTNDRDGSRVFHIDDGTSALLDVEIAGLTLTNGDSSGMGGAIFTAENLTVVASSITGNNAAHGGGIYASGANVTIRDSTISENLSSATTGDGGGISKSGGSLTVTNSTISGNRANNRGGGIHDFSGSLTIQHSTITGNTADGDNNGAGRGGGVFVDPVLTTASLDHTIVAGNLIPAARDDANGALTASFSLIGDNTGATITDNGGNQIGTAGSPINPRLGGLANNGGPTLTHAFLANSPAVDAGNAALASLPFNDQRGQLFTRVFDGDGVGGPLIDIGAYERQSLSLVVDTLVDEFDVNYSPGDRSLREAIEASEGNAVGNIITFAASLTSGGPAILLLTLGELLIDGSLTITGPGADLLTIDASGNDPTPTMNNGDGSRVFDVDNSNAGLSQVSIRSLGLTGGDSSAGVGGGAVYNEEFLTVTDCRIFGNSAISLSGNISGRGGGISNAGNLTISDSTISSNTTNGSGGGVSSSEDLIVVNCTISGNSGDGVRVLASAATISGSTINGNSGVGLYSTAADTLTLTNCTISGNSGRGIFSEHGVVVLRHSTITSNFIGVASSGTTFPFVTRTILHSTIVAGNANSDVNLVFGSENTFESDGFNLIGMGNALAAFNQPGDQTGVANAMLGPLANNGGPTLTHALLAGSPALDAGDPAAAPGVGGVPEFDQRGSPFTRVFDSVGAGGVGIDIGALELQPVAPSGDFDGDSDVDGSDFLAWQRGLGASGAAATRANGNADGDGDVDGADLAAWKSQFGLPIAAAAAAPSEAIPPAPLEPRATARDALFAGGDFAALFAPLENSVRGKRRLWRR